MVEECMFGDLESYPVPGGYVRPASIDVREVTLIMEAIMLPTGEMTMWFHHFDARELPIVALNTGRNFFLAKPMMIDGRNHFSTDLDSVDW